MLRRLRTTLTRSADRGASAVEYGLMLAAIAAIIVGVVFGFGGAVNGMFDSTKTCLEQNAENPGGLSDC